MYKQAWAGVLLAGALMVPASAKWMDSSMAGQMLLQIPLIVTAGYLIGRSLVRKWPSLASSMGGAPGMLLIIFTFLFWMLPRSLDLSLTYAPAEWAKFVTLSLFIGIPLGAGWRHMGFIARGFIWIHLISMIFLMSWLYAASPVRVCNRYLIDQQRLAGWILLAIGVAIVLYHMGMAVVHALASDEPEELSELSDPYAPME